VSLVEPSEIINRQIHVLAKRFNDKKIGRTGKFPNDS